MEIFEAYKLAKKIRIVENNILDLFSKGKIYGTTHTSIGQELISVILMNLLEVDDFVFSNHRCHGHYLGYGGPLKPFFAEIMGKNTGLCGGRGGSQHIQYKNFFSNGIQGGIVGNSTGLALANKLKKNNSLVLVFLGDGTLGEGLVYESLNFASKNNLKILFVIENNQYAMSTHINESLAIDFNKLGSLFGIKNFESSTFDYFSFIETSQNVFNHVNSFSKPVIYTINTYRLSAHSKGDDHRSKSELDFWAKKDFINEYECNLDKDVIKDYEILIQNQISQILEEVEKDTNSTFSEINYDTDLKLNFNSELLFSIKGETVREDLNNALNLSLIDDGVFLLGEDLRDPYGGAFKITKNLSKIFSDKIINTAISEAGIVSWGIGASLAGLTPICEIMFGDFLTLATDQIINHGAKYNWLYNGKVSTNLIIRTPIGGRRGYGATHSQSLEKIFLGIPGLIIIANNNVLPSIQLFKRIISVEQLPVLFLENKTLYNIAMLKHENNKLGGFNYLTTKEFYPSILLGLDSFESFDLIIITYSELVNTATNISKSFMINYEINIGVFAISQISPLNIDQLTPFLRSKNLLIIEEGHEFGNWGDSFVSSLNKKGLLKTFDSVNNLSSKLIPIPIEKNYEDYVLLSENTIIDKIKEILKV